MGLNKKSPSSRVTNSCKQDFRETIEINNKTNVNTLCRSFKGNNFLLSLQSPAHSYSSYDSGKNESVDRGAEDLSLNRGDEDEDDHDDHDDSEKVNETDGVEAERLKAFNVSFATLPVQLNFYHFTFMLLLVGKCGYFRDMFV